MMKIATLTLVLTVFLALPVVTHATKSTALNPTAVNLGDCVADQLAIQRPRSAAEIERDVKWCSEVDVAGLDREDCKKQKRKQTTKDVAFFTDRCDAKNYFVSIDGREYKLTRVGPKKAFKKSPLEGKFEGQGVVVEVKYVKTIESKKDGDIESGSANVDVNIAQGAKKNQFKAILNYGP
jgi:hypothetical protein